MNPIPPPQAINNERPQMQPQNPPVASNPSFNTNISGLMRPRMVAPNPNVRFEGNNYQQFQQQQGNMNINYQQRPRFPQGEPPRFQPNPSNGNFPRPEGPRPDFQRGPGGPPMFGQRVLPPGQPPRFPTPQQPIRPPMNGVPNQNSQQNLFQQQMESQNHRYQTNDSKMLESENYRTNNNIPRNQPPLSRKSSTLDLNPLQDISNNKILQPETKFQPEIKQEEEPTSEQNSFSESENEAEEKKEKAKPKIKEKIQKTNSQMKIEEVTSGLVGKNIKFFEENDTAKTPLTPTAPGSVKRKQRSESVSSDVVKSEFYEDDYESGVDETPMVHPNLRSIYQPPSKVARIPFLKTKKSKKCKSEEKIKKTKTPWVSIYSGSVKSSSLHSNCKHGSSKRQKIEEKFCPEEELLAFFHSSKTTRTQKRDGSLKNDQNATKDKLVNKPTTNGDINTPKKTPSKLPASSKKNPTLSSPTKTPLKSPGTPGTKSLPKTPETPTPPTPLIKKVPMNKIQVGAAPSPNLKAVRSKVGSLANTTHKPGGGNIKIESHKIDFSKTQPRIEAKNDQYAPSGGDKKITQVKLQWSAKSKVGSLENATYKPGGGDKKIESVKLDFKEKAKPKVGSKDNVKHVPGGGAVKIENQKLEFKAQSKVGSLDNVKHKPGGGDIKIFDDKTYLKQISGNSSEGRVSGTQSYGDLSIVREVEGRSAPGTPGRKTSVKIKKTTTVHSSGVKNTTEVIVASQTPKKQKRDEKKSSKQEVKLTYSKLSPSQQNNGDQSPVRIMRLPARDDAPILKPDLSDKEAFEDIKETSKDLKNFENFKQTSGSSDLLDGKLNTKNDSGISKFLQDELVTHEKIGEMWKERNNMEVNLGIPANNSTGITNQRTIIQNSSKLPPEPVARTTVPQFSNFPSSQSSVRPLQPQSIYQPNLITQNQQLTPQPRISNSSIQQQEVRYVTPNQNLPFNSQF